MPDITTILLFIAGLFFIVSGVSVAISTRRQALRSYFRKYSSNQKVVLGICLVLIAIGGWLIWMVVG